MRPTRSHPFRLLLGLALLFSADSGQSGYWDRQIDFPPLLESDPPGVPAPAFGSDGLHLLTLLEVRTDLGRQQIQQIDSLVRERRVQAGVYSMDRIAGEWTRKYVEDFRRDNQVSIPIFSILDEGLRGIFKGYNAGRMQAFPHTLVVDASGTIHRILVGVQSAEQLAEALDLANLSKGHNVLPDSRNEQNQVINGGFEEVTEENVPTAWGTHPPSDGGILSAKGEGWNSTACIETRSASDKATRAAYQIIPHAPLLGKSVILRAMARSNSLGEPRVVLAVPHPQVEEGMDFVPTPVLRTQSGRGIPLRILGSLEYQSGRSDWQSAEAALEVPPDARALVILVYLANPEATGGAARFDEIQVIPD